MIARFRPIKSFGSLIVSIGCVCLLLSSGNATALKKHDHVIASSSVNAKKNEAVIRISRGVAQIYHKGNKLYIKLNNKQYKKLIRAISLSNIVKSVHYSGDNSHIVVTLNSKNGPYNFAHSRLGSSSIIAVTGAHNKADLTQNKKRLPLSLKDDPAYHRRMKNTPKLGLKKVLPLPPLSKDNAQHPIHSPLVTDNVPKEEAKPEDAPYKAEVVVPPIKEADPPKEEARKETTSAIKEEIAKMAPKILLPEVKSTPPTKPVVKTVKKLEVKLNVMPSSADIDFLFEREVGAAVFLHDNELWIVYDYPYDVDVTPIKSTGIFASVTSKYDDSHTIMRFKGTAINNTRIQRSNDFDWVLNVGIVSKSGDAKAKPSTDFIPPVNQIAVDKVLDKVNIAMVHTGNMLKIKDDNRGFNIYVFPLNRFNYGMYPSKAFVDMQIPVTKQGVVVLEVADSIKIEDSKVGVSIKLPSESYHSLRKAHKSGQEEIEQLQTSINTDKPLFSLEEWNEPKEAMFKSDQNKLQKLINDAPVYKRDDLRLKLARFYLGHKMAPEAYSILEASKYRTPSLARHKEVATLQAVAQFWQGQYIDALKTLSMINRDFLSKKQNREWDLWNGTVKGILHDRETPHPNYLDNLDIIDLYPEYIKKKLLLLDLEAQYIRRNFPEMESLLAHATRNKLLDDNNRNDFQYYRAVLAEESDDAVIAEKIWSKLENNTADQANRARAMIVHTKYLINRGQLSDVDAINRLEEVGMAWRGNEYDNDALLMLGDLYMKTGQYKEALTRYKESMTVFPINMDNARTSAKMSQIFTKIMLGEIPNNLSDIDIVALYYEFTELTPIGSKGTAVIMALTERLKKLDLLDQASALLRYQLEYRLKGDELKSATMKLAELYLENNKPKQVLELFTDYGDIFSTENEKNNRDYLKAEAMLALNDYDGVDHLFKTQYTKEALNFKLTSYWNAKKWGNIVALIETELHRESYGGRELSKQEKIDYVSRLAVAYLMQDNIKDLHRVYVANREIINKDNWAKDFFDILLAQDTPVNYRFLDKTVALNTMENFIKSYEQHFNIRHNN